MPLSRCTSIPLLSTDVTLRQNPIRISEFTRLFPVVLMLIKIYNLRTTTERINGQLFNDYGLHPLIINL